MDLAPDFSEFLGLLNEHRAEFVIVGAYALALHGAPRYTGDLDILVRPTFDNAERVILAIRAFGFPAEDLTPETIVASTCLVQMGVPPVQVHVMSAIDGVTWDDVWAGRDDAVLAGLHIPFIGRTAFLRNKQAAGRPQDLADIDALGGSGQ